jgi:nitrogen fixation-related uncharacterized protein
MTEAQVFSLLRDIVMGAITIFVFFWGRDRKQTADAIAQEFKLRDERIEGLKFRMDQAGKESSDLTDMVQVLATREEMLRIEAAQDLKADVMGMAIHSLDKRLVAVESEIEFSKRRGEQG